MKYIRYIIFLIMGLITSFFIWMYVQRVHLDYNAEGNFFSPESGIVYHEHAKNVYGILALIGLILLGVLINRFKKEKRE